MKILVATDKPFAKVAVDGIRKEIEAAGYEFALLEKYTEKGMVGIKGHRSVGGFRASCYNALPKESVQALIDCMQEFEKLH